MNLRVLFDQLEEIRYSSSRADKDRVLQEIVHSENAWVLEAIASFVYDPYRKVFIKVTDDVLEFADPELVDYSDKTDEVVWGQFVSLLHNLEQRYLTGDAARTRIALFLESVDLEDRDWFIAILNKDLKIGVGRKIIEKHIPNVAPKFEVQLCPSKQWDGRLIAPGGWLVSPKIDGIRGVIGPFGDSGEYVSLSRNGKRLYNTDHIVDELTGLAATFNRRNDMFPVFDGEFYTHGWELSSSITSTQTPHPEAHRLQYHVFDLIPYPEWRRGHCKASAQLRDVMLGKVVAYCSPSIVHVPSILTVDPEEARLVTQAYVDDGYEGSVLKGAESLYEFKRSKAWMKFKPSYDIDLPVTRLDLGWIDSQGQMFVDGDPRAVGTRCVRSLVVDLAGVETHVGSGLTHEQRRLYPAFPDQIIGKTVTVRYQRVSEDGRLIFPRFCGVRSDK